MKFRKILASTLACLLVCALMAGCGAESTPPSTVSDSAATSSKEPASTSKASDAELEIWVYGWEKASADKVAEDAVSYGEENGVKITVTPVAVDSYSTKIQATLAGGNAPDMCFLDAGVQSTQLASKGKLLGLKQFGVEDLKDKFYDSVWDTMVYKDDVYGLRITSNNLAVFYNKELFDKANLPYPTEDWTWEEMRNDAKLLTDPDNGVFGLDLAIYAKNGYAWTWLPFLWSNNGEFLNEDRTEAVFNSPEGVQALEFWRSMVDEGSIPLQAAPSGVNRFTSGLSAMVVDGPWNLNPFLSDPNFKDKFDVVSIPKNNASSEHSTTVVGGEGIAIFSDTKYPQEAYDYLVHLTCSDFTKTFWENWITVPPQPEFKDFYADDGKYGPFLQVFSDQMETSKTRPFTPSWPQIEDSTGIDLQTYMFGKEDDAQVVLDKAAENVNKLLAEDNK